MPSSFHRSGSDGPSTSATPSRRTLVRGAAWSVPVVMTAGAAPAFAASRDFGLNGWVSVRRQAPSFCTTGATSRISIDGRGDYPDRGLWVYPTRVGDTVRDISITFYVSANIPPLTFARAEGDAGAWSVPTSVGLTTVDGTSVRAYTMRYLRTVTAAEGLTVLIANPHFTATYSGCRPVSMWARRSVTINGEVLSFTRGPISFPASGATPRSAPQGAPSSDEATGSRTTPDAAAETAAPQSDEAAITEPPSGDDTGMETLTEAL